MAYTQRWERLSDALTRVMEANGLTRDKAAVDICRAIADKANDLPRRAPRQWVRSWHEALDQLETNYPYWRRLHPDYIEPAFRAQIVGAFLLR